MAENPSYRPRRADLRAARDARRRMLRRIGLAAVSAVAIAGVALAVGLALRNGRLAGETAVPRAGATPSGTMEAVSTQPSTPPPPPAPARAATITVTGVGDMIFDRKVKALVASRGGEAPLARVASLLADADITIGNLESVIADSGERNTAKDVTFRGHPAAIAGLQASGFDFLTLANNHVLDYGPRPLADTITALDGAGIGHAGAGANKVAAWAPAVREVTTSEGTASVAFLGFSHILPPGFVAGESRPGLAAGRADMEAVAGAIAAAKQEHDYVIVSFHWGVEYKDFANGDQVTDAHRAVDAGADMVLSHHPHVIQGVELYNGRLIAYSLGDFVFDHYSRKTGEAFILDASLGPDGVTDVVATPVYLDDSGAPAVVSGAEAHAILSRLKTISGPHATSVVIEGDIARIVK